MKVPGSKREIVAMGQPRSIPLAKVGHYVIRRAGRFCRVETMLQ